MIPLSVCIPTYEMHGNGRVYLAQSFEVLAGQSFKDFNVIISDHSANDDVRDLCQQYHGRLDIRYFRNERKRGNSSANLNHALRNADGALAKILFQDDFLSSSTSLEAIIDAFDLGRDHWLITACEHTRDGITTERPFFPRYNQNIHLGENTISSPSVLTIRNEQPLLFDEHLIWLMDCDYYRRLYDTFGEPNILNTITVVNRMGDHQVSNTSATPELRERELRYVRKKFGDRTPLSERLRTTFARARKHIRGQ